MGNKEREIVIDDKLIIGIISLLIGVFGIASLFFPLIGVPQTVVALLFFYIPYKIYYKKENGERLFIILLLILIGLFILSFILTSWFIGFAEG